MTRTLRMVTSCVLSPLLIRKSIVPPAYALRNDASDRLKITVFTSLALSVFVTLAVDTIAFVAVL